MSRYDIIGDVHGGANLLEGLLDRLGYQWRPQLRTLPTVQDMDLDQDFHYASVGVRPFPNFGQRVIGVGEYAGETLSSAG